MIQVGVVLINVHVPRWYLCFCVGCEAAIWLSVDPSCITSYRCPACACRIDRAPRHGQYGMAEPDEPRVRLGDGLFVGLPERFEARVLGQ